MIAPMKKVYLVLCEKDKAQGLLALRKLGLVHLETGQASGSTYDSAIRDLGTVSKAANIVFDKKANPAASLEPEAAVSLARRILEAEARRAAIYEELGVVEKKLESCLPWGEVNPTILSGLAEEGIFLRFYHAEEARLASLPPELEYIVLSRKGKSLRLVIVSMGAPAPNLPSDFVEFVPPSSSTESLREERAALLAEKDELAAFLSASAADVHSLKAAATWLDQDIRYETAKASFVGDSGLCAVKGFAPASREAELVEVAKKEGWAILLDDPAPEDATPTKIENGRLVGTIKPIFDFLGIVPAYSEYEISSWFLVFFCLFTAMIFGDGGYGSLMFIGWLVLSIKSRKKGQGPSDSLRLFFFISVLTMVWGALTGTWFSIKAESLPAFLRNLAFWPISSANPGGLKNIQIFCFILGSLQLTIARVKNVIRDFPNPKFLAQVGSLALIVGMLYLVLNLVVDSKRFPVPPFVIWLVAGGFTANVVFGAYEGNILKSTVEGLKSIIPTFLGSVGVFADIVSYIRLWALGLAGSSLAAIINGMGGGLLKPALIGIFGVIILVFGHGLNLILSVLSVVVHAIRLNILEFSCNHLGMQWSGTAYDPFRTTYKENS